MSDGCGNDTINHGSNVNNKKKKKEKKRKEKNKNGISR